MYTSQVILLRNAVRSVIETARLASQFNYNAFTSDVTHIPLAKLTDSATQAGIVHCIGSLADDADRRTREPQRPVLVRREAIIQVSFQRSNIVADDITTLDLMCGLVEQLRDVVKNGIYSAVFGNEEVAAPAWIRNEALKDEDGLPYTYYLLREANTFETYFNAWFSYPHL